MKLTFIPALASILGMFSLPLGRSGVAAATSGPSEAVAPDFGPHVLVFAPSMTNIQSRIDALLQQQERSQFGSNRPSKKVD